MSQTERVLNIRVEDLLAPLRLDSYLATLKDLNLSRSYIADLIEKEEILLNGKKTKASAKLKNLDSITVTIPQAKPLDLAAENIPLDILFEDEDLLVINKAVGMLVHPTPSRSSKTLVNALLYHCGASLSQINGVLRPGIVHRLDRDTSGLMIVCKSDLAHKDIAQQIKDRTVSRFYKALVWGNIKEESGTVIKPIGRDFNDRKKMRTYDTLDHARFAKTNWTVIQRYKHLYSDDVFTLLECKLDTGRTHQIRVHMNYIKHPILGDPLYGIEKNKIKAYRPLLHSYKLSFKHPVNKEILSFEIDLADDFKESLKFLIEKEAK